jgi:hypothetical protein
LYALLATSISVPVLVKSYKQKIESQIAVRSVLLGLSAWGNYFRGSGCILSTTIVVSSLINLTIDILQILLYSPLSNFFLIDTYSKISYLFNKVSLSL